jgi:hypothetical protein
MGEVQVPALAKYGAQTQRAVENFAISGHGLSRHHIAALAQIKRAAAIANGELGLFDAAIADAIISAADEVISGRWDEEFPIDVFQTGSGTSSNMNTNEVIARLATERPGSPVHPNDHVNASQSSNDVFPASIHIAATEAIVTVLIPALTHLAETLQRKSEEFADVVKSGRTHLMDATPVTLGQEFGGYAAQIRLAVQRLTSACPGWPNCPFEAKAAQDSVVETSGVLRTVAVSLIKICNDLRWMGSGPRASRTRRPRQGGRGAGGGAGDHRSGRLFGRDPPERTGPGSRLPAMMGRGTEPPAQIRRELGETMEAGAGIFRTQAGMAATAATIAGLKERYTQVRVVDTCPVYNTDWATTVELGAMLDVAEAMVISALGREESRGSHQRLDGALGLVLWHCCHRAFHALHDLKLHPPEIVRSAIYGVALLGPAIGYALCLAA